MNTLLLILQKHSVLTLRAIEMTAIIIINVTPEVGAQLPEWLGILYVCIYVPVCMKTHVHTHLPDFG